MKILLTGGRGMLGRTLCNMWQDMEILSTDIPEMDITNIGAFDTLCKKEYPDVVIHCAAVTAVDNCEANQEIAWKVNTLGSLNVASVCNRHNIRLIALSTDYVFDGFKDRPYNEFDLPSGGVNIYGQSKWAGEQALFEPIAPIMLLLVLLGSMAQEDQVLCIPYWGSLMQRAVN